MTDAEFTADYPALAAHLGMTPEQRDAEAADLRARLEHLEQLMSEKNLVTLHHTCHPPYLARTGLCDCSRCCATGPHDPGCMTTERTTQPQCTCPDTADYHRPRCPEYDALPDARRRAAGRAQQ